MNKLLKQREVLDRQIENIDSMQPGITTLRYFKEAEVEQYVTKLEEFKTILKSSEIPKKEVLKQIFTETELIRDYLTHLFSENLLNDQCDVDETFAPEINRHEQEYRQKLAKAFEAKQKRAPGFDEVGGRSKN